MTPNQHPESVEEIPVNLPFRPAIVVFRDGEGNTIVFRGRDGSVIQENIWEVAEYNEAYVCRCPEIDKVIVAEPGANVSVTWLDDE